MTSVARDREMWRCARCGRTFANVNQTHTCRELRTLEDHLAGVEPAVVAAFERLRELVEACGPVSVLPEATRIAFHARMSFAVAVPRRQWLDGHLVLARVVDDPRFRAVTTFSPRNHVHAFRVRSPDAFDSRFAELIAEAYRVGRQEHLAGAPAGSAGSGRRSGVC